MQYLEKYFKNYKAIFYFRMSLNDSEFNINPNDPYFKAVKAVFDNWTALQVILNYLIRNLNNLKLPTL